MTVVGKERKKAPFWGNYTEFYKVSIKLLDDSVRLPLNEKLFPTELKSADENFFFLFFFFFTLFRFLFSFTSCINQLRKNIKWGKKITTS